MYQTDGVSLRSFITTFLKRCDVNYQGSEKPIADMDALCISEASARGYLGGNDVILRRSIGVGATIAATGYSHLRDEDVQIYIALYTSFLTYLDDVVLSHIDAVREFVPRFVARQPQQLKALDDLAALLLEMPRFHNAVSCNIILTSTLDFVSSLLIQYDILGVPVSVHSPILDNRLISPYRRYRLLLRNILCSSDASRVSAMPTLLSSFLPTCLCIPGYMHSQISRTACALLSTYFIPAELDLRLTSVLKRYIVFL